MTPEKRAEGDFWMGCVGIVFVIVGLVAITLVLSGTIANGYHYTNISPNQAWTGAAVVFCAGILILGLGGFALYALWKSLLLE